MSSVDQGGIEFLADAYDSRDGPAVRAAVRRLLRDASNRLADAVWHPLGFFRVDVGSDGEERHYMLHCWPLGLLRRTQSPAWLLHCHVWDLESVVLVGSLQDSQHDRAHDPDAGVLVGRLYLARGFRPVSLLERTDETAHLSHAAWQEMDSGDFYRVPVGRFHQTLVAPTDFCLTLARVGPKVHDAAKVAGDTDGPKRLYYRLETVDQSVASDYVRRV